MILDVIDSHNRKIFTRKGGVFGYGKHDKAENTFIIFGQIKQYRQLEKKYREEIQTKK